MSDYNWCHGPRCHKRHTTTRVRGVKGSKVLRTMKVKQDRVSIWKYFCDQTCMHDFFWKHFQEIVALHPRSEALETPIKDPVKVTSEYGWVHTEIKEVDNNSNTG